MRQLLLFLISSLLIAGCDYVADPPSAGNSDIPAAFNMAAAPTVEFTLPDMMCEDGCAMAVKDILQRQPGAKDVAVDFEGKTATVAIDKNTFDAEQALADLVDKGFLNSVLAGQDPSATPQALAAPAQPAPPSSPSD